MNLKPKEKLDAIVSRLAPKLRRTWKFLDESIGITSVDIASLTGEPVQNEASRLTALRRKGIARAELRPDGRLAHFRRTEWSREFQQFEQSLSSSGSLRLESRKNRRPLSRETGRAILEHIEDMIGSLNAVALTGRKIAEVLREDLESELDVDGGADAKPD